MSENKDVATTQHSSDTEELETSKRNHHIVTVEIGNYEVSIEDVWGIAHQAARVKLCENPKFLQRIAKGQVTVQNLMKGNCVIYGVNTGYGNNCRVKVPEALINDLPDHLVDYHCCGMGKYFNDQETRAILAMRVTSLARGYSGVRLELLRQLVTFLDKDILPCIPQTGSVGASGDLTPLSYVAATLCGRRNVRFNGKTQAAENVLEEVKMFFFIRSSIESRVSLLFKNS